MMCLGKIASKWGIYSLGLLTNFLFYVLIYGKVEKQISICFMIVRFDIRHFPANKQVTSTYHIISTIAKYLDWRWTSWGRITAAKRPTQGKP